MSYNLFFRYYRMKGNTYIKNNSYKGTNLFSLDSKNIQAYNPSFLLTTLPGYYPNATIFIQDTKRE